MQNDVTEEELAIIASLIEHEKELSRSGDKGKEENVYDAVIHVVSSPHREPPNLQSEYEHYPTAILQELLLDLQNVRYPGSKSTASDIYAMQRFYEDRNMRLDAIRTIIAKRQSLSDAPKNYFSESKVSLLDSLDAQSEETEILNVPIRRTGLISEMPQTTGPSKSRRESNICQSGTSDMKLSLDRQQCMKCGKLRYQWIDSIVHVSGTVSIDFIRVNELTSENNRICIFLFDYVRFSNIVGREGLYDFNVYRLTKDELNELRPIQIRSNNKLFSIHGRIQERLNHVGYELLLYDADAPEPMPLTYLDVIELTGSKSKHTIDINMMFEVEFDSEYKL
jgi:hypothetical protein